MTRSAAIRGTVRSGLIRILQLGCIQCSQHAYNRAPTLTLGAAGRPPVLGLLLAEAAHLNAAEEDAQVADGAWIPWAVVLGESGDPPMSQPRGH